MAILPKKFTVSTVASTWPRNVLPPRFPRMPRRYEIDVAEVLLMIGRLTTPVLASGASLAEFWAYARYIFAWQSDESLTLTPEFAELDAHQKTILSDDVGMGLPMHWLSRRMNLIGICDGRYFIERYLATYGGTYTGKAAKRGPGKAPDFICVSRNGKFHVVECKGTQTSTAYRDEQLGLPINKGLRGGRAQKRTVTFPAHIAGQRLACGTFISSSTEHRSHLKIIDPEEPPLLAVGEDNAPMAFDPMTRGALAQMLRASGFPQAANLAAFPEGRPRGIEGERYVFAPLEERAERFREAREEMAERPRAEDLTSDRGPLVGRRSIIELPAPLILNDRIVRRIELQQGVNPELVSDDAASLLQEHIIKRKEDPGVLGATAFESDKDEVVMSVGKLFRSELKLLY
ncbi:hypothetical protein [Sphingomonas sp. PvP056]|uniref:hypothetical protein n=1 Tax=Sphingomonas sp. PvP056 TaxID=3156392 RepID=UPI003395A22B